MNDAASTTPDPGTPDEEDQLRLEQAFVQVFKPERYRPLLPGTEPLVLSPVRQVYGDRSYRIHGRFFWSYGCFLPAEVWRANGRDIPDGHRVLPIDYDGTNNRLDNLHLVAPDALRKYNRQLNRRPMPKQDISPIHEEERAWHATPEGLAWHRDHYGMLSEKINRRATFTCVQCGKDFDGKVSAVTRFCGGRCKIAFQRASKEYDEDRTCVVCGTVFRVNKFDHKRACNPSTCGDILWRVERNWTPKGDYSHWSKADQVKIAESNAALLEKVNAYRLKIDVEASIARRRPDPGTMPRYRGAGLIPARKR